LDDEGTEALLQFARRTGINYPVVQADRQMVSLYQAADILPTTYYISRDGMVLASVKGVINEEQVEQNITEALGRESPDRNRPQTLDGVARKQDSGYKPYSESHVQSP